ncbi:large-conductance mechanosensitive channel [Streptomyces narbonensis]
MWLIGLATGSVGHFSEAKFSIGKTVCLYGIAISAGIAFVITAAVLYFQIVAPLAKDQAAVRK